MNILKITILFVAFSFLTPTKTVAQDTNASQAFWVHEDPIYPAVVSDYEQYCEDLVNNCKKYDVKTAKWTTISTDDLRYFHLTEIENMGDLDNSRFSVLQEKMGDEDFNQMFENFDNCYDTHTDYIIHLDKELSYMPEGYEDNLEFRKMQFWYSTPQNFQKVLDLAKQFKDLYIRKNSKEYYRLYRSGFGADGQFIIVAISAKTAADYEQIFETNKALLGADRAPIYNELLKAIIKMETLNGYMRMDLSYTPKE